MGDSVVGYPRVLRCAHQPAASGPHSVSTVLAQLDAWIVSPSLQLLSETRGHWRTVQRLVDQGDVRGPMIHDAKIAAICLDHGITQLITIDRDFSRFPDLGVRDLG